MNILSLVLLSIAVSLDNTVVGLVYGLRGIRISVQVNLMIAAISGLGVIVSAFSGNFLSTLLPKHIVNYLGGTIIAIIGIWSLVCYFSDKRNEPLNPYDQSSKHELEAILRKPEKADTDASGDISIREAMVLGIALALNAFATGLGAAMTGVNIMGLTLGVMICSLLAIGGGIKLGHYYGRHVLGRIASPIAGIILVIVGIYEMFI